MSYDIEDIEGALRELVASCGELPATNSQAFNRAYSRACAVLDGVHPGEQFRRMCNPMGGMVRVFEVAAGRLRAGEPLESVLDDYGLKFVERAA